MASPVSSTINETADTSNTCVARSKNFFQVHPENHHRLPSPPTCPADSTCAPGAVSAFVGRREGRALRMRTSELAALQACVSMPQPLAPGRPPRGSTSTTSAEPANSGRIRSSSFPRRPGTASIQLSRGLRRHAVDQGASTWIMIDHRSLRCPRPRRPRRRPTPPRLSPSSRLSTMSAAVLDDARVDKAAISRNVLRARPISPRDSDIHHLIGSTRSVSGFTVLSAQDVDAAHNATRRVYGTARTEPPGFAPKVRKLVGDQRARPRARTAHRGNSTVSSDPPAVPNPVEARSSCCTDQARTSTHVLDQPSRVPLQP